MIVMNTCVVRQSAENKAYGYLHSLRPLKEQHPSLVVNLMGCLVGVKGHEKLKQRFPFVDVFSPPSDPGPLVSYLTQEESRRLEHGEVAQRFVLMDESADVSSALRLPQAERDRSDVKHALQFLEHGTRGFYVMPANPGAPVVVSLGDRVYFPVSVDYGLDS